MKVLTIAVGPSRRLAGLLGGMHVFAAAMCWLVPVPPWLAVSAMPLLLGSAAHVLRRDGFRVSPRALITLRIDADCRCEYQSRSGEWRDAELLGTSFVSPYLAVLNLKPADGRFAKHLVILPDAVNADD
ncbi:MAG: hypothetical protein PHX38_13925, partial [Sulfuricella sp.]|nr:hypothetical protein [Sulfuricella sp.]